ncbi:hypothetical protein HGRIS_006328 [Hohenbuehelia grisea]|uniref:Uncharacterized protein n=1 Tax=Hohenbuehelia grisea TaxID=104357 RepID=A0ABR3K0G0_9AGAR
MQVVPILNTMVAKANHIYTRWAEGEEAPLALRHTFADMEQTDSLMGMPGSPQQQYQQHHSQQPQQQQEPEVDSFAHAHRSLSQCIAEVHQRAMILFPTRKPCQCSAKLATRDTPCPPSHSWSPPPKLSAAQAMSPVLPDLYSSGTWMYGVLPGDGPGVPGASVGLNAISPSSRMAMVDTLNFDFGALNQSSWSDGQSWMAWF